VDGIRLTVDGKKKFQALKFRDLKGKRKKVKGKSQKTGTGRATITATLSSLSFLRTLSPTLFFWSLELESWNWFEIWNL
jgi:hypothetical protein